MLGVSDPSPQVFSKSDLVVLGQTVGANYGDPPKKGVCHRVPPFRVTQGHWNRLGSIGYV